jgi:flagellar biosynthesis GTPase FlhF
MLAKALKNLLTPKAEKIETTQDLRSKCLDKDICGLLLKGAKTSPNYVKDAIEKLVVEYPKVAFGAVDTSVLYVKGLEAEYMPEFQPGTPRFVVFQKVAGSADKSKNDSSRLKTSLIPLEGGLGYGPMSNLVASVVSKKADMQKVSTLPTIKTRTKKLEEEERAKRQRRQDQQQRGQDKDSGGTPGGYFTDNDGSAEGRKAERERRRAEHRKSNPNFKEKTPEEIAEMERKRRARMEEEAAKWNMAPDDAPDEGEQVDGGNDGSYSMDWDDEDTDGANGDQNDDEDDEDVLDLD